MRERWLARRETIISRLTIWTIRFLLAMVQTTFKVSLAMTYLVAALAMICFRVDKVMTPWWAVPATTSCKGGRETIYTISPLETVSISFWTKAVTTGCN